MDRPDALDCLVRESQTMVDPVHAEIVCNAFGVSLEKIGITPKPIIELAKESLSPAYPGLGGTSHLSQIKKGREDRPAVYMYEVAARLALHFGLYANIDHAMQSPYHRATSEIRYVGCRAAVRLARMFGGGDSVTRLRERNPWMEPRLFREDPYTGTGEKLKVNRTEKLGPGWKN